MGKKIDTKLLLLILTGFIVIAGMLLEPSRDPPSDLRYFLSDFGGFLVIFFAVLVGVDGIKSFTLKSTMGKALLFICLGMLSWGVGSLSWLYYNIIAHVEVPYPSVADIGYLGTIPLVAIGLFLLLKTFVEKFDLPTILKMTLLPLIVFIVTYVLFIQNAVSSETGLLENILNVMYPLGDVVFLSFALIILSLTFGGMLFKPMAVLSLGFILEAIADFAFSFSTAAGTYYAGYWGDMVFCTAFMTLGIGMYLIRSESDKSTSHA